RSGFFLRHRSPGQAMRFAVVLESGGALFLRGSAKAVDANEVPHRRAELRLLARLFRRAQRSPKRTQLVRISSKNEIHEGPARGKDLQLQDAVLQQDRWQAEVVGVRLGGGRWWSFRGCLGAANQEQSSD